MLEEIETKPCILPYTFYRLPKNRVLIIHPTGLKMVRSKPQVEMELSGEIHPMRDNTSHEYKMWEEALRVINEEKDHLAQ